MNKSRLLLTFLLCLPFVFLYLFYWLNHDASLFPTGIIQYDNVGYAAYAKQSLDADPFSFTYSNPFEDSPHYPRILFQTQNIFLAGLMKLGISPGVAVCLFSFFCCLLCVYVIISLFDHFFPEAKHRNICLLLLVWGGGVLALASGLIIPFRPQPGIPFWEKLIYLDPAKGWWGLSFGRPLYFGVESYYHLVFWLAVLTMFLRKWLLALALCLILCFSHPFTGIHLLLTLLAFVSVEKLVYKKKDIPSWFMFGMIVLIGIHLYYYLVFLNRFASHKSVSDQYSQNWNYHLYHFGPAYLIVFALTLVSIRIQTWKGFIAQQRNRFFLTLAAVSFLLSNHELFLKPMQPIHFARGYEWTSYFFMALPAIVFILERLKKRVVVLGIFVVFFLLDNIVWFGNYAASRVKEPSVGHITREQKQILKLIQDRSTEETLILGSDPILPYLSTIYSKAYAWYSHPYTTSYAMYKRSAYAKFLETGQPDPAWKGRDIIFILNKNYSEELNREHGLHPGFQLLLPTTNYLVLHGKF